MRSDDVEAQRLPFRPYFDGAPRGLGQQAVAAEGVVHAVLDPHVQRLTQAEQHVFGRGPGVFQVMQIAFPLCPVPVGRAQAGGLVHGARALVRRHEPQSGRHHQPFLRPRHRDIHAPRIHLERHAPERGDRIDHQQSIVTGGATRLANRGYIVDHARGGIDLRHQNRLDRPTRVGLQPRLDLFRPNRSAEIAGQDFDVHAHAARILPPAHGEAAAFQDQDFVALRQHVGQRCLPRPVPVRDVDVGAAFGAEHARDIAVQTVRQRQQRPVVDIDRRAMHRAEDFVGDGGGAGDGQKLSSGAQGHGRRSPWGVAAS